MKREDWSDNGNGRAQPSANGLLLEKMAPTLARYMLDVQWDNGDSRLVCWVRIQMKGGMWEVQLADPNYARLISLQVENWGQCIPGLEAALNANPAPWQAASWLERFKPKGKGRKKT